MILWELILSLLTLLIKNWYLLLIPFVVVAVICSFQFWKDKIDTEE